MNDQALQLALAKMLPEKMTYDNMKAVYWIHKIRTRAKVEDTEWLHICWLVEQTLHPDKQCEYVDELEQSMRRDENKYFGDELEKHFPLNHWGRFAVLSASWQQRAAALQRCLE